MKTVEARLAPLVIRFVVADVRKPLVAVTALTDRGFDVTFGREALIANRETGTEVLLGRRGNSFFLAALQGQTRLTADEVNVAGRAASSSGPSADPAGGVPQSGAVEVRFDAKEAETLRCLSCLARRSRRGTL